MEIPKEVRELPKAPKGVQEWIIKDVVEKAYIIFNKKDKKAVCTRCGHTFGTDELGEIKHNQKDICPDCKNEITYKAYGIGRKNLTEQTRVLTFAKKGKSIYGVLTEVDIEFDDYKPNLFIWQSAVYKFNSKGRIYYKHHPGWCWGAESWEKYKEPKVPAIPHIGLYRLKRDGLHVYTDNFKSLFKNTDLQYAYIPQFINKLDGFELIRYMDLSLKYQSIELLQKSGFESLAYNKLNGETSRAINWRGKDLRKVLKLNMAEIRKFRDQAINAIELEIYQEYRKQGVLLEIDEINLIHWAYSYTVSAIEEVTTLVKAAKYIAHQNKNYQMQNRLDDYKDYIEDCKKLGLDIRKNSILFPLDFYKTHMELVDKIQAVNDKKINSKIKKIVKQAEDVTKEYLFRNLRIQAATTAGELREESAQLGHCVKGYANKIANGEGLIFFIRKINNPKASYYTLELKYDLKMWKMVQCRGKKNCNMTDEVKEFVDRWMAEVVNAKPKKRKKVA
ncbi:MAG: PcfJ domain-containing protein [Aminipila sp.]